MTLHTWSTQPSPGCHLPPPQNELTTPFSDFPSCHAWSLCTYLCSSLYFWHDVCNELQDELSLREWASGNYKYQFNLSPGLEKQVDKCWGFHGFLWPHARACWGWGRSYSAPKIRRKGLVVTVRNVLICIDGNAFLNSWWNLGICCLKIIQKR